VFSDVPHILFAAAESATGRPAAANTAGASRQGAVR
jgi:hypothetical protein